MIKISIIKFKYPGHFIYLCEYFVNFVYYFPDSFIINAAIYSDHVILLDIFFGKPSLILIEIVGHILLNSDV